VTYSDELLAEVRKSLVEKEGFASPNCRFGRAGIRPDLLGIWGLLPQESTCLGGPPSKSGPSSQNRGQAVDLCRKLKQSGT
jgi:hypothetical protein